MTHFRSQNIYLAPPIIILNSNDFRAVENSEVMTDIKRILSSLSSFLFLRLP